MRLVDCITRVSGPSLLVLALAAASPLSGQTSRRTTTGRTHGPAASPHGGSLQVSLGFARLRFDVRRSLAEAKSDLVPLTVKYGGGGKVASVQVPGVVSLALGLRSGSFEQTIPNVDIRALMKQDEAAILSRCTATLDHHDAEVVETVYDAQVPFTLNAPDGALVASTTVPYQLGVTCERVPPLSVRLAPTTIEYSLARPLAEAKGGVVPVAVRFNGTGRVSSLQVPGASSYPLGEHVGSFEQTMNADVRALLKPEEAAIQERCRATLDYHQADAINTVHDARLPLTVNAPDGSVVASVTVPYQLGLTCRR